MRRILTVAGLVVAVAAPSLAPVKASAESYCEHRAHERKVTGTLLGAIGGGLLGNAVSHGGGRTGGTLIGAGVGAVVGNNLARVNCDRRAYYRHRTRRSAYSSANYRYPGAPSPYVNSGGYASVRGACRYETRPYYDARGQLVYAPSQVCG
jgi:uncharacterized protein YcfJ